MEPIKTESYNETIKLFQVLSQTKVISPYSSLTIYNILNQIQNVIWIFIKEEKKEDQFIKLAEVTNKELANLNKGYTHTYFKSKSDEWEKELRYFAFNKMKEDDFTPGGV